MSKFRVLVLVVILASLASCNGCTEENTSSFEANKLNCIVDKPVIAEPPLLNRLYMGFRLEGRDYSIAETNKYIFYASKDEVSILGTNGEIQKKVKIACSNPVFYETDSDLLLFDLADFSHDKFEEINDECKMGISQYIRSVYRYEEGKGFVQMVLTHGAEVGIIRTTMCEPLMYDTRKHVALSIRTYKESVVFEIDNELTEELHRISEEWSRSRLAVYGMLEKDGRKLVDSSYLKQINAELYNGIKSSTNSLYIRSVLLYEGISGATVIVSRRSHSQFYFFDSKGTELLSLRFPRDVDIMLAQDHVLIHSYGRLFRCSNEGKVSSLGSAFSNNTDQWQTSDMNVLSIPRTWESALGNIKLLNPASGLLLAETANISSFVETRFSPVTDTLMTLERTLDGKGFVCVYSVNENAISLVERKLISEGKLLLARSAYDTKQQPFLAALLYNRNLKSPETVICFLRNGVLTIKEFPYIQTGVLTGPPRVLTIDENGILYFLDQLDERKICMLDLMAKNPNSTECIYKPEVTDFSQPLIAVIPTLNDFIAMTSDTRIMRIAKPAGVNDYENTLSVAQMCSPSCFVVRRTALPVFIDEEVMNYGLLLFAQKNTLKIFDVFCKQGFGNIFVDRRDASSGFYGWAREGMFSKCSFSKREK